MNRRIRQIFIRTVLSIGTAGMLCMVHPGSVTYADEIVLQTESSSLENPMVAPGRSSRISGDSFSARSAPRRRAAANTGNIVYQGSYGDELKQSGSQGAVFLYQQLVSYYIGKDHAALKEANGSLNCIIDNDRFRELYSFHATGSGSGVDTSSAEYIAAKNAFQYDMQSAIDAFDYDYPEAFDLVADGYKWAIYRNGTNACIYRVEVEFRESYSGAAADVTRWREALPAKAASIWDNPDTDLNQDGKISDAELVRGIHNYLCDRFYYDTTRLNNYTVTKNFQIFGAAAAVLDDLPMGVVCEGYSRSMKAFCDYFDIPACIVAGSVTNSDMGHMWNAIRVAGRWYLTDVTWDDQKDGYKDQYLLVANISGRSANGRFSSTRVDAFTFIYPSISSSDYDWATAPESEKQTEAQTPPESEKQTEAQSAPESEKQTEAQTAPESEKQTEAQSAPESEKQTEAQTPPESEKQTEAQTTPESEKQTEAQTPPESEKQTEAQSTPESEKQPVNNGSTQKQNPSKETSPVTNKKSTTPTVSTAQNTSPVVTSPAVSTNPAPAAKAVPAPKRPKITQVKAKGGRKVLVRWTKDKSVNGFELQYSEKKNFAKAKTIKIAKGKTSRTITKLKKNKTVYIRLRAYKVVQGKKVYSKWSVKRKVKVR